MPIRPKRVGPYYKIEVEAEEEGKVSLQSGQLWDTFWCGASPGMGSCHGKPWRVALATGYSTKEIRRGDQVHILSLAFRTQSHPWI